MNPFIKVVARRIVPGWVREWRAQRHRARVVRVTARVVEIANGVVVGGPFAGMRYVSRSHTSQLAPKLIGTYERELRGIMDEIAVLAPDRIVDAGAAEGYYAVGLLRLVPQARVIAFEADEAAREDLAALAALNDVSDRLEVRGLCEGPDIHAALAGARCPLVVMDIEGGCRSVLDPAHAPVLRSSWILVELHPHLVPDVRAVLSQRFGSTHRIRYVAAVDRSPRTLPRVAALSRKELLAASWEARADGQGWLWMVPLAGARSP